MLEYPSITWRLFASVCRESWRGKTLLRTLMNETLRSVTVSGKVLDLGSGGEGGSYGRFLHYTAGAVVTHTDFYRGGEGMVKLDLEKPFPLDSSSFDTITCFNVLEHVYDARNLIAESHRVLGSGGMFVGATPFLVNYHPDPHDFARYTHEAIKRMFASSGFVVERIVSLGFGPLSVSASYTASILPKFLRGLVLLPAICIDAILLRMKPALRGRYPLGFLYVCRKA